MTGIHSITINRKLLTRIFSKIKVSTEHFYNETPCWEWTRHISPDGYGNLYYKGTSWRAHRALYDLFVEPFPEGLESDHLCEIRHCVNPCHIEPVTHQENLLRSEPYMRITCKRGHPINKQNTHVQGNRRRCRVCFRDNSRREWANSKPDDPKRIHKRERQKAWRQNPDNRAKERAYAKEYSKQYRTKNHEKIKEAYRVWYQANKHKIDKQKQREADVRYRARKKAKLLQNP